MGNSRGTSSNHFVLSTTGGDASDERHSGDIAFLAALLLPASGPAFGAPRVRDIWHAYVADGQRYGSVHTVVARLPDGNYRITAESRMMLDVLGAPEGGDSSSTASTSSRRTTGRSRSQARGSEDRARRRSRPGAAARRWR